MTTAATGRPDLLAATGLPRMLLDPLAAAFTVHTALASAPRERIRGIVGTGEAKVSADLVAELPALEIVSIMGVGYDGVDVAAAMARGVIVTHTPGVLDDDVADLAIALALNVARRIPHAERYLRTGRWAAEGPPPLATKFSRARMGIVGMGRIGRAIAQRASAFGTRIAYTARRAKPELPYTFIDDIVMLARASDFLVAITPGGAATREIIDADVLAALGPQGYLINVARGSVVDEAALIAALTTGTIAGAGLDVFQNEPYVPEALLALDNVVVVPHIGSATHATRQAMADLARRNLELHFAGKPPQSPVPECC
jgi:lactate dehydrogenase-like 2-hydroxyacid dehydrogenase